MRVSIVTISHNQSRFLEQALRSVLNQDYDNIEYIVVDADSTDGSRWIIEKYRHRINKIVFEADDGPADGLNKGFRMATGQIYGFLNADDILFPEAVTKAVHFFKQSPEIDVISADTHMIDENGALIRKLYSDAFSLARYAYGATFIAQQSTFFRGSRFHRVDGCNIHNHCAWDGELFVEMALDGAQFRVVRDFWSGFRIHPDSISGSGRRLREFNRYQKRIFKKIMHRQWQPMDGIMRLYYLMVKHLLNPRGVISKIQQNRF